MASVTSTGKEIMTAPQQQQRNQYPQGPSSSAASGAQQPEDELKKKNTDCVYFLASPLTCKKGSECEYRHSEYARVNPRDCFYWLNGNCLNPKCAFRHPPLDGLLGPQAAGPPGAAVPSLPPPQPVTSSAYIPAKQAVPCIFFQKGYCMKGDKCQFLHGPAYSVGKVQQVPATAGVVSEPANFKKPFGIEKCSQQKMFQQANAAKSVEVPNLSKPSAKVSSAFPVNGMLAENGGPPSNGCVVEHPEPRAPSALNCNGMLKSNSSLGHHSIPVDDRSFQNGRDTEESLRESSPGFDVLVDDQHGDTEYYHNKDRLTRLGGHDGRNLEDFEFRHPDYYNSEADADQDRFHEPLSYNSYDCRQQSYGYEHSRASSERSLREAAHFDRRGLLKAEDRIRESDLRNRLKQRKVGSMRSVISSDHAPTSQVDDQGYQNSRRDIQHSPPLENSHRSRLQGRLRVRRSSPINGHGVYTERETNRGRNWGSLSPSKPQSVPHQGRLRNRLGRRVQDDTPDVKSFTNFAAPKSLAELKVSKQPHGKEQEQHMKPERSIASANGKRKLQDNSQQGESDLSFEGPKPLSEILKRKKRAEASAVENHVESKEQVTKSHFSAPDNKEEHKQAPASVSSVSEQQVHTLNKGENNHVISDVKHRDSDNKSKSTAAGTSEANKPDELEAGEGLIDGEDEYHEEPEGEYEYEEAEGDYEYEEGDVEDYGGENAEGEEDFMEEDDGDDFAKRIGVVPV